MLGRGRGALGLLEQPHKRPSLRHDNGPFPSRSELFNDAALHRSRREDVVLGCERFRVPLTIDASLLRATPAARGSARRLKTIERMRRSASGVFGEFTGPRARALQNLF